MTTTFRSTLNWGEPRTDRLMATTTTDRTHGRRWSTDSDTDHPRGSPPPQYSEPISTTDSYALDEQIYPDDGIDYQARPSWLQLSEMLNKSEDEMWAVLLDDINDICMETVLRYRRPTFRAVEHLAIIILNLPIPPILCCIDHKMAYDVARKIASEIFDEHDWATSEHGPIRQRFGLVLPHSFVPHLDRIKAILRTKIGFFYALLSEAILRARLESTGSLVTSTRRVNQDLTTTGWRYTCHIETILEQYVCYHLLVWGYQDSWIFSEETTIARLLLIACFTETDSPIQTLEKMRDRLRKIMAVYQFRMLDPVLTLAEEWIETAVHALGRVGTSYHLLLYRMARRMTVCDCDNVPPTFDTAQADFWCPWHGARLNCPPPFFPLDPFGGHGPGQS